MDEIHERLKEGEYCGEQGCKICVNRLIGEIVETFEKVVAPARVTPRLGTPPTDRWEEDC